MSEYCATCKYHCRKCDKLADRGTQHKEGDMLCWCCKHAVPNNDGNGCEWSISGKMPKGVTTEQRMTTYTTFDKEGHRVQRQKFEDIIVGCPKFERG